MLPYFPVTKMTKLNSTALRFVDLKVEYKANLLPKDNRLEMRGLHFTWH